MRFVFAGIALGAIAGAVAALIYTRAAGPEEREGVQEPLPELGASRIARLGLAVLATVREILALT